MKKEGSEFYSAVQAIATSKQEKKIEQEYKKILKRITKAIWKTAKKGEDVLLIDVPVSSEQTKTQVVRTLRSQGFFVRHERHRMPTPRRGYRQGDKCLALTIEWKVDDREAVEDKRG